MKTMSSDDTAAYSSALSTRFKVRGLPMLPSYGHERPDGSAGYVPKTPSSPGDYEALERAVAKRERKAALRIREQAARDIDNQIKNQFKNEKTQS